MSRLIRQVLKSTKSIKKLAFSRQLSALSLSDRRERAC